MKKTKMAIPGTMAAAQAMRQINPDVVAAYPITPQTETVMSFSQFVADGEVDTEMVRVESEHSAMSACVGAAAAGARVMTATSANGLALMHEIVYIAASCRLPIIMPVINRALSGPINIHCDHSDTMAERDSSWLQIFCENGQEVYENILLALKLAENPNVLLPVMVNQDGFITSHSVEIVEILEDDVVKNFIGEYNAEHSLLDVDNPVSYGPLDLFDYYFEHKKQQVDAIDNALKLYLEVGKELSKITGNEYPYFEAINLEDAEHVIVTMSSTAGTTKYVIEQLKEKGKKVGLLKPRLFRPFPGKEIAAALENAKTVSVLDRSASFGAEPPLFSEIKSALYNSKNRPVLNSYIFGLGGRDIKPEDIKQVYKDMEDDKDFDETQYIGVR